MAQTVRKYFKGGVCVISSEKRRNIFETTHTMICEKKVVKIMLRDAQNSFYVIH